MLLVLLYNKDEQEKSSYPRLQGYTLIQHGKLTIYCQLTLYCMLMLLDNLANTILHSSTIHPCSMKPHCSMENGYNQGLARNSM